MACRSHMLATLLLIVLAIVFNTVQSLITTINGGTPTCFFEPIGEIGVKLAGNFAVISDKSRGVAVKAIIYGPENKRLWSSILVKGRFVVVSELAGEHRICFENTRPRNSVAVDFDIRVGEALIDMIATKSKHLGPLEKEISSLSQAVHEFTVTQRSESIIDSHHLKTANNVQSRVAWNCFCEAAVIGMLAIGQIWFYQRMFSNKSLLG